MFNVGKILETLFFTEKSESELKKQERIFQQQTKSLCLSGNLNPVPWPGYSYDIIHTPFNETSELHGIFTAVVFFTVGLISVC